MKIGDLNLWEPTAAERATDRQDEMLVRRRKEAGHSGAGMTEPPWLTATSREYEPGDILRIAEETFELACEITGFHEKEYGPIARFEPSESDWVGGA